MASEICNISLGRINEFVARVDGNDPTNSTFELFLFLDTSIADNDYRDADDIAAVEAITDVTEVADASYASKVLSDTDVAASTVDDTADTRDWDLSPDPVWSALAGGDAIKKLVVGYDSNSTGGTDVNIVAVAHYDFVVTSNGGDVTAQVHADGMWSAGQV